MADKRYVFVCMNIDCRGRGAGKVMDRLRSGLQGGGCGDVELRSYMCFGDCHEGPNVVVYPDKVWYEGVQEKDVDEIVEKHLKQGEAVRSLTGTVDKGLEKLIYRLLDDGVFE